MNKQIKELMYKPKMGKSHPRSKLTEKDVREIRASELGATELAKKFGVSQGAISKIRLRLSWTHLK